MYRTRSTNKLLYNGVSSLVTCPYNPLKVHGSSCSNAKSRNMVIIPEACCNQSTDDWPPKITKQISPHFMFYPQSFFPIRRGEIVCSSHTNLFLLVWVGNSMAESRNNLRAKGGTLVKTTRKRLAGRWCEGRPTLRWFQHSFNETTPKWAVPKKMELCLILACAWKEGRKYPCKWSFVFIFSQGWTLRPLGIWQFCRVSVAPLFPLVNVCAALGRTPEEITVSWAR